MGPLYVQGDNGYAPYAHGSNARFNGLFPAAVSLCAGGADVAACIAFAQMSGIRFAIRSGGHSYTGWSTCPGLVLDLRLMASVAVDTTARVARIGAGARLIDIYQAVSAKGLAVGGGTCSDVGVSGLILGGGIGVMSRSWGLTLDSLLGADVVYPDGGLRRVDDTHDPDLFWALRGGGGGSFGAVTSFDVALRPAPSVAMYSLTFAWQAAAGVIDAWQHWAPVADPRLSSFAHLYATNPTHSRTCEVVGTWTGPAAQLTPILNGFVTSTRATPTKRSLQKKTYMGAMLAEAGCTSYEACQPSGPAIQQRGPFAATSGILSQPLPPSGIQTMLDRVSAGLNVPNMRRASASLDALGGAVARVPVADTAFVHRSAIADVQYRANWDSATSDPAPMDAYVRDMRDSMYSWCGVGAYVNYLSADIKYYGAAYWGTNYPRLRSIKKAFDPGNVFSFPQSVQPA